MFRFATDGGLLADLVHDAIALFRAAQEKLPQRTGPGRKPVYEQWHLAVLIYFAILHRRKSKSAMYRFLQSRQEQLLKWLRLKRLPSRSLFMQRYRDAWPLLQQAIQLQGRKAVQEHIADASTVAVDKSLIPAKGPRGHVWHRHGKEPHQRLTGVDMEAAWGKSPHHGWVYGYSYEVVVCATKKGMIFPLLASVDTASRNEHKSFAQKIPLLPPSVKYVLADTGYDGNQLGDALEYDKHGRPTGRHFLCAPQSRGGKPALGQIVQKGKREVCRQHRAKRERFRTTPRGRALYRLRREKIEPFNQWFKCTFELEDHVWHRGRENNDTMVLAGMFANQMLLRHSFKHGNRDGQIKWMLDQL